MQMQQGYPAKWRKKVQDLYNGHESKESFAYDAGEVPGTIRLGASKTRPLLAIAFFYSLVVKNEPDVETMTGSGLYVANRLFDKIKAKDNKDILIDIGLDTPLSIQDTFFRDTLDTEVFEDILQTAEDTLEGGFVLPCYSEVPVNLDLSLADISTEYTDGTFSVGATQIYVSAIYGDGRLGFEAPMIEQHAKVCAAARNALNSISMNNPFMGIIISRSSYAVGESGQIYLGMQSISMKDDKNTEHFEIEAPSLRLHHRNAPAQSLEVLTDSEGHLNNATAEVALTLTSESAVKFVAIFTTHDGVTAAKGNTGSKDSQ